MAKKSNALEIGKTRFNLTHLRSISEKRAILDYGHLDRAHVVNAWKQANGFTVRNNRKKTTKKKKTEE